MQDALIEGQVVRLDRGYVEVSGPDAQDFLERMLSNEVAPLEIGGARLALLLTPKGRIIAPLRTVRMSEESFVLVTDVSALASAVADALRASRFASRCEISSRDWQGFVAFGNRPSVQVFETHDFGEIAWEGWRDTGIDGAPGDASISLERMRIETGTPAWGKEIDESVLPAEAGLDESHISFTKGCFPGQEPVARLHYRGHANRRLRRLEVEGAAPGAEILWNDKVVGRVTSAVDGHALGYVRTEVPEGARLVVGDSEARLH